MKNILAALGALALVASALAASGQKFTEGTERVIAINASASWTEGQVSPDSVQITAYAAVKATNDADATEVREVRSRSVSFNSIRADRSITLPGVGSLTYTQVTRALALMVSDAAARPDVTTGLTATPGSTQVVLTWAASTRATSYTVKRATVNGGPYSNVATGITATTYTNTGLTSGTTYYYVITPNNATGPADDSAQASATPVP